MVLLWSGGSSRRVKILSKSHVGHDSICAECLTPAEGEVIPSQPGLR